MSAKFIAALSLVVGACAPPSGMGQETGIDRAQTIPLIVPAGAPLRLYLTKRVSKRLNAPVEAKLLTPLYSFDREVVPAGAVALGYVSRVQPVPKPDRVRAMLGGDFTPLRIAGIEFTSLRLPDGRTLDLHTAESPGLDTLVPLKPPKRSKQSQQTGATGIAGKAKQTARDQIDAQVAQIEGIPGLVRGTSKKELVSDYLVSRLPYHPQSIRNRTRFDAELLDPLHFGSETVSPQSLALVGSQPAAGAVVHARLLTPLDSMSSTKGEKVEAVLEQPLFSSDRKLVLPEGTHVEGSVAMVKRAGWFHHGGRLRFTFQSVDLPPEMAALRQAGEAASPEERTLQFRTQAALSSAESGKAPLKVDKEGGVQAAESKKRFIGTALAAMVARRAGDMDMMHSPSGAITGQSANVGGRTLGGGMGFGLLGMIAAQSSRNVGAAFGYYGLA